MALIYILSISETIFPEMFTPKGATLDEESLLLPLPESHGQTIDNDPRVYINVQQGMIVDLTVDQGIQCKDDCPKFGPLYQSLSLLSGMSWLKC